MEKTSLLIKKFYFFMGNKYHVQRITNIIKRICREGKRDVSLPTSNSDNRVICISSQPAQLRVSCCLQLNATEVNLLAILTSSSAVQKQLPNRKFYSQELFKFLEYLELNKIWKCFIQCG